MSNVLVTSFISTFSDVWGGVASVAPRVIIAVLLLVVGALIADLLAKAVQWVFTTLTIDALLRKGGVDAYIERGGVRLNTGVFFGALVKWFLIVVVLIQSLKFLQLGAVNAFLGTIAGYVPQVAVGMLVLLTGLFVGEVVEHVVSFAARLSGLGREKLLGSVSRWAVWVFSFIIALYHLGVTAVLSEMVVNGLVMALALATGLAFGLGGQDAAGRFIARIQAETKDK